MSKKVIFPYLILISLFNSLYFSNYLLNEHFLKEIKEAVSVISSNLEAQIYSDIQHTNTLSAIAISKINRSEKQWSSISKHIFSKSQHLKILGIAPDDIIESIYPIEGNEKALGLNYRTIPEQWHAIQEAKNTNTIHISKPLELVQGGLSIIAFNPIFLDPPENNIYWGNSGAVLDIDNLLKSEYILNLDDFYELSIKSIGHGLNRDEEYFLLGNSEIFSNSIWKEVIQFPSNKWVVSISTNDQISMFDIFKFVVLLGITLLHMLFFLVYKQFCLLYLKSTEDDLTKLANRRFFMSYLDKNIKKSIKRGNYFSIVNLDLNGFKLINDTYGHSYGDSVLIEVAKRIKSSVRNIDLVSRIGGDEFVIYLSNIKNEKQLNAIINRLNSFISKEPIIINGQHVFITSSIGYYLNQGEDVSIEKALAVADASMYNHKNKLPSRERETP